MKIFPEQMKLVVLLLNNPKFLAEFDRLQGTSLSRPLSPIESMVDQASGKLKSDLQKLMEGAEELWKTLPLEAREELNNVGSR